MLNPMPLHHHGSLHIQGIACEQPAWDYLLWTCSLVGFCRQLPGQISVLRGTKGPGPAIVLSGWAPSHQVQYLKWLLPC